MRVRCIETSASQVSLIHPQVYIALSKNKTMRIYSQNQQYHTNVETGKSFVVLINWFRCPYGALSLVDESSPYQT